MNILLVTETYLPEINGVARTLTRMVRGLTDLGHRIILVRPRQRRATGTLTDTDKQIETHEVRGLPLPGYPGLQFGLPSGGIFKRLLAHNDIDAAYIATEGPLGRSALQACSRHGIPALSGMHTNFHQYSRHYGAGLLAPMLLAYLKRFHNRLAGTLVPTATMAGQLRAAGFERLSVWPRGVHGDLFQPEKRSTTLRASWGLDDDQLGVLYVGRLAAEKNMDTAFAAFDAIHQRHPSARFALVGDGPIESTLRRAHPHAIFCGATTGDELARHYASGDIFLFPSKTETFGNVVLEAMASGLAVVSYDLAAAHELIEHGRNGLKAGDLGQAAFVNQALVCADDKQLRETLKRHARATALKQDWSKLITALESLFVTIREEDSRDGLEGTAESVERP